MGNHSRITLEEIAPQYSNVTPATRLKRWRKLNSYFAVLSQWEINHVIEAFKLLGYDEAVRQAERTLRASDLTIDNPEEIP